MDILRICHNAPSLPHGFIRGVLVFAGLALLLAPSAPAADMPAPQSSPSPAPSPSHSRFIAVLDASGADAIFSLLSRSLSGRFQFSDDLGPLLSTEPRYGGRPPRGGPCSLVPLPEAFTIVFWLKLPPDSPAAVLLGLGEPGVGYLMFARDTVGAPMLLMFGENETTQTGRAPTGAANLADGELHSIAMLINRASGLVRMYVDGEPEFASITSGFALQRIGRAFAQWTLVDSFFDPRRHVFSPRIFKRELTATEIQALRPGKAGPGDSFLAETERISAFNASLFASTLALFPSDTATPKRTLPRRVATQIKN